MVKLGLSHNVKPWLRSCTARCGSQLGKRRKLERVEKMDNSKNLQGGLQSSGPYTEPKQVMEVFCNVYLGPKRKGDLGCQIQPHSFFPSLVHSAQATHSTGFRPADLFLASKKLGYFQQIKMRRYFHLQFPGTIPF